MMSGSTLREMRNVTISMKPQFPNEQSDTGEFERQEDAFREWITSEPSAKFSAVAGRYC
jgi:putative glutathione S-transferase